MLQASARCKRYESWNLQDEAFPCKTNSCYKYLPFCVCSRNEHIFLPKVDYCLPYFLPICLLPVTECNFPPSLLSFCYHRICFQAFLLLDTVGCTVGEELNETKSYLKRQEIKKCMQFAETYCTWRNAVFIWFNADYTTPLCAPVEK